MCYDIVETISDICAGIEIVVDCKAVGLLTTCLVAALCSGVREGTLRLGTGIAPRQSCIAARENLNLLAWRLQQRSFQGAHMFELCSGEFAGA